MADKHIPFDRRYLTSVHRKAVAHFDETSWAAVKNKQLVIDIVNALFGIPEAFKDGTEPREQLKRVMPAPSATGSGMTEQSTNAIVSLSTLLAAPSTQYPWSVPIVPFFRLSTGTLSSGNSAAPPPVMPTPTSAFMEDSSRVWQQMFGRSAFDPYHNQQSIRMKLQNSIMQRPQTLSLPAVQSTVMETPTTTTATAPAVESTLTQNSQQHLDVRPAIASLKILANTALSMSVEKNLEQESAEDDEMPGTSSSTNDRKRKNCD